MMTFYQQFYVVVEGFKNKPPPLCSSWAPPSQRVRLRRHGVQPLLCKVSVRVSEGQRLQTPGWVLQLNWKGSFSSPKPMHTPVNPYESFIKKEKFK